MSTFARAYNSSIKHVLVPGTKTTKCGKDATLMARWSGSETTTDRRIWKRCSKCM